MRPSTCFILLLTTGLVLLLLMGIHARSSRISRQAELQERAMLVHRLRLTDLCLFTEARYTRHPAMADLHAPFQDHPTALEHFPSGSLVTPPVTLQRSYAPRP
ncbi:hypothetical protein SAMN02745119_01930 [Trichlorobacter thiogenes]|uniref:Uncharacterized protein n=1 Tax=Trichlorobacter thiogenes TaxID=115783 RepID=A0A1T4PC80_9BACT|nr:hypothetical protein [Trichlorobacter thiogenes]SJZ89089.1 hypothetical protein SAMN02745119_01930 [Trichlorobacter thiogenes]